MYINYFRKGEPCNWPPDGSVRRGVRGPPGGLRGDAGAEQFFGSLSSRFDHLTADSGSVPSPPDGVA